MADRTIQTEYVDHEQGRFAYDVVGDGPLLVLSPGVADIRSTYRLLAPLIADAGHRVASVELRGHGGSSTGWDSYSHQDTAGDLIQVTKKLGGPGVIAGHSFSGGATTIAAATHPDLVSAIVEISPFTRPQKYGVPVRKATFPAPASSPRPRQQPLPPTAAEPSPSAPRPFSPRSSHSRYLSTDTEATPAFAALIDVDDQGPAHRSGRGEIPHGRFSALRRNKAPAGRCFLTRAFVVAGAGFEPATFGL